MKILVKSLKGSIHDLLEVLVRRSCVDPTFERGPCMILQRPFYKDVVVSLVKSFKGSWQADLGDAVKKIHICLANFLGVSVFCGK